MNSNQNKFYTFKQIKCMAKKAKSKKSAAPKKNSSKANPENTLIEIKNEITAIEVDLPKLLNGTKASGRRIRKSAQALRNLGKQLRVEVQEVVNGL